MKSTIYERRIEQEWRLLQSLAAANPEVVIAKDRRTVESGVAFDINLLKTEALVTAGDGLTRRDSHQVTLHFPRFFPAMPIEASLACPVFHPNVNPETGFACLWGKFSAGDTVIEAVVQLQKVIVWELLNRESEHLMQPAALGWFDSPGREICLPLPRQKVRVPQDFMRTRSYRKLPPSLRRRLS